MCARANEHGPGGAGETAPSLAVDIAAADLRHLADLLDL
jgi:hypothetical protein